MEYTGEQPWIVIVRKVQNGSRVYGSPVLGEKKKMIRLEDQSVSRAWAR